MKQFLSTIAFLLLTQTIVAQKFVADPFKGKQIVGFKFNYRDKNEINNQVTIEAIDDSASSFSINLGPIQSYDFKNRTMYSLYRRKDWDSLVPLIITHNEEMNVFDHNRSDNYYDEINIWNARNSEIGIIIYAKSDISIDSSNLRIIDILGNDTISNNEITIRNTYVQELLLDRYSFPQQYENLYEMFIDTKCDTLTLQKCKIYGECNFDGMYLPKYININGLSFNDSKGILDLTSFNFSDTSKCLLTLDGVDISRIKLDYSHFKLIFDHNLSDINSLKEARYKDLLDMQIKYGFNEGRKDIDIDLKQFEYRKNRDLLGLFKDKVDSWWWNYGYNKEWIFKRSLEIFFFFFLINLFIYSRLAAVYCPKSIKEFEITVNNGYVYTSTLANRFNFLVTKISIIFLYTAFTFWGIKLNADELKIDKLTFLFILLIEYLVGLICLGYLAGYILGK